MYKNNQIQEYANSNYRQFVQKLLSAKYCTRQILNVYSNTCSFIRLPSKSGALTTELFQSQQILWASLRVFVD